MSRGVGFGAGEPNPRPRPRCADTEIMRPFLESFLRVALRLRKERSGLEPDSLIGARIGPISQSMRTARARWCSVAFVALAITLATAVPASANLRIDDGNGGSSPVISDFGAVTLNGSAQLSTATIAPFTIIDDSGSGAGWNLSLQVPDFQNGTGVGCATGATATIPANTLTMDAPVVAPADNSTTMDGVTAQAFVDFTSPQKIIIADVNQGAGTYTVAPAVMRLTIPSTAFADAYCTEVTLALSSGP